MARRGRPRKTRMEQPRRKRPDKGTGEVQLLRAWYAGQGDPALTSYPLGILLANAVLTDDQHKAVCRYAWLHWAVFGRPSVAAVSWGAKLALALARRVPHRVERVVLITPGFFPRVDIPFTQKLSAACWSILQPRHRFKIPLDDAERFTAN